MKFGDNIQWNSKITFDEIKYEDNFKRNYLQTNIVYANS